MITNKMMYVLLTSLILLANSAGAQDGSRVKLIGELYADWRQTNDVVVVENYAYVTDGTTGLKIVDITDPKTPTEVGRCNTPGYALRLSVSGKYAFIADSTEGIRVIDISNPAKPYEIGFGDTPGNALSVATLGNYAYVADDIEGLRIIDISTPNNPVEVGSFSTIGRASKVVVSGNYTYITERDSGIQIVDVSNPSQPVGVGLLPTIGRCYDLAIWGDYAYVTVQDTVRPSHYDLFVVNISNPLQPSLTSIWRGDYGSLFHLTVQDSFAYLLYESNHDELLILDTSNPAILVKIGSWNLGSIPRNLTVAGTYAFITFYSVGMQIWDISVPNNTTKIGVIGAPYRDNMWDITISEKYAYLIGFCHGFSIADITDPTAPFETGFCSIPGARSAALSGNYAFVAAGDEGIKVINIANPYQPLEVGSCQMAGSVTDVAVSANFDFVTTYDSSFQVVDISSPENPFRVATCKLGANAEAMALQGKYAYLAAGSEGLRIIDISNPVASYEVGFYKPLGYCQHVAVSEKYAFLSWRTEGVMEHSGFSTVDISNPIEPRLVCLDPSVRTDKIIISDNFAYLLSGGIRVLDISNPAQPRKVGGLKTRWWPYDAAVTAGGLLYVGESYYFDIYDISGLTAVREMSPLPPSSFSLSPAFPNPFNAFTQISYQLPQLSPVSLTAYDPSGRVVATLVNEVQTAGEHSVGWSAEGLGSGVYLLKLTAGERVMIQKTVLLK